jgi:hypothetical protein
MVSSNMSIRLQSNQQDLLTHAERSVRQGVAMALVTTGA